MEAVEFIKMSSEHGKEVMDIFNYYIENSFAAYPDRKLPYEFYAKFLEMTKGYPAYVIKLNNQIEGFCFIRAFNPFPAFKETAEITYFIKKESIGKGIGKQALDKLELEAKNMGITKILASISSRNIESLSFHKKYGFIESGRLQGIGKKFNKNFDVIWMQKDLH